MSCPTNMSVSPNDRSTFCGTEEKGGSTCLTNCCDKQSSYCASACSGNEKCQNKCLIERGCSNKYIQSSDHYWSGVGNDILDAFEDVGSLFDM